MAGAWSSKFSLATANVIEELKNSSKNENTSKSTLFWLSVWRKWCVEKKIESEIQNIPPEELNILLERFYAKVKKKHDDDYEPWPDSLKGKLTALGPRLHGTGCNILTLASQRHAHN